METQKRSKKCKVRGRPKPCMLGQMDFEERKKLKPMEGNYNDY